MVDKYVKDRPVFIRRYDGHMALANSTALEARGRHRRHEGRAGRSHRPPGGRKVARRYSSRQRDVTGDRHIPEPDDAEILEAVLRHSSTRGARRHEQSQDMDGSPQATRRTYLRVLSGSHATGSSPAGSTSAGPSARTSEIAALGVEAEFGGDFVRLGGVKGFMDGSLGSSTAKMFEPYDDATANTGVYVTQPDRMRR